MGQTREKALEKVKTILDDGTILEYLRKETARLINSGGIECNGYLPESYAPAKLVITVALERASRLYTPPSTWRGKELEDLQNLRHF